MVRRTLDSGVLGQYSIKVQILAPVFCRLAADYIKRMRSMACDFGAGREIGYPLSETANRRIWEMEELKTCPFCGGNAFIRVNPQTLNCLVNCPNCEVVMKRNFKGSKRVEEVLIELMAQAWNKRVGDRP